MLKIISSPFIFFLFTQILYFNFNGQELQLRKCEFSIESNNLSEQKFENNVTELSDRVKISGQQYSIPTVVHVVYHSGIENVSDSDIYRMINIINQDFNRTNYDTLNTPAAFAVFADKAPFTFCLTDVDPSGNPSNGINRVYTDTNRFVIANNMKLTSAGGSDSWDADQFFNIWIGNADLFDVGPTYPVSIYNVPSQSYGLATDYRYIINLSLGDTSALYSGRSLTHDLGHCFGLSHPFNIAGCSDTDTLSDTPLSAAPSTGCNTFPFYDNCTNVFPGIMFMNFMDLSDENCTNLFTTQQVTKMTNNIQTYLPQLSVSGACLWNSVDDPIESFVSLYPNPFSEQLHILSSDNQFWNVQIYSLTGKNILQFNFNKENYYDTSDLESGIYLVQLSNSKNSFYRKMIKM